MLVVIAAFVAPYLITRCAFRAAQSVVLFASCLLIEMSPLLMPANQAFMLAVVSGLSALAALWRLLGGVARDCMDRPFLTHTPADFWRRCNRNMQQFFRRDVFAAATARVEAEGGTRIVLIAATLAFTLLTSVLFFASIHHVVPFYSRGLPEWLWGH
jgi:D-alanyl-lipoteichoic acid acyltransferase DltB (MBOAT superfamily)